MNDFTLKAVVTPEVTVNDPLSELLRVGARGLIAQAVEAIVLGIFKVLYDRRILPS